MTITYQTFKQARHIVYCGMPVADILIDSRHYEQLSKDYPFIAGKRTMLSVSKAAALDAELSNLPDSDIRIVAGGSLANSAYIAAVAHPYHTHQFVAACADDVYGRIFQRALHDAGIEVVPASPTGTATSRSYVIANESGERAIIRTMGDSMQQLEAASVNNIISTADLVIMEGELAALRDDYTLWHAIADASSQHRVPLGLTLFGEEQIVQHRSLYDATIRNQVSMLFGNEQELAVLLDEADAPFNEQCEKAAAMMQPPAALVMSHGGEPAYLCVGQNSVLVHGAPVANIVNTLGAGDAFMGGCLAALLGGASIEAAGKTGHQIAAQVIGQEAPQLAVTQLKSHFA